MGLEATNIVNSWHPSQLAKSHFSRRPEKKAEARQDLAYTSSEFTFNTSENHHQAGKEI